MQKLLHYNSDSQLQIEGCTFESICHKYPTPLYVYSSSSIQKNCNQVLDLSKNVDLLACYALKANYNPKLIKLIHGFGFGADVVSGGELFFARKAGIPENKIVFAGVGKTEQEIEEAVKLQIHSINVESESELGLIEKITSKTKKKVTIAFRVNPDINPKTHPYISTGIHSSKFGIPRDLAIELFKRASKHPYIEPAGIHVHIGSQIDQEDPYLETADYLINMKEQLKSAGINISFLDLGGGIGINYLNQLDVNENQQTYLSKILPKLLAPFNNMQVKLLIELGRSIIGSAGFLVTKVLHIKQTPLKKFIIVDAAMNNLIRPSLYQAHHQILPINRVTGSTEIADVVGPVCETADFMAKDRELPAVRPGDYLVITGAGAYGQALSSNYNLRPMIAEYLIKDNDAEIIFNGESIQSISDKYIW
jgi:diaminopimelate decarboxylase